MFTTLIESLTDRTQRYEVEVLCKGSLLILSLTDPTQHAFMTSINLRTGLGTTRYGNEVTNTVFVAREYFHEGILEGLEYWDDCQKYYVDLSK
ncbi:hypothetical protein [Vibrio pomeroyi]|uniref:hypothetical protein n=1 Tax=Vibrio pomeroyi TaxID=198832 RepID=UPI0035A66A14